MTDFLKLGKGITGALTAAKRVSERDANLAKFLEDSKTQMRLYHGTTATEGGKEAIRQLKSSKEGALGSGVYLTPQASHASGYSGIPNDEALALMRNSDYGNIDHGKKMADQFMADRAAGTVREGQEGGNMLPVYAQLKNPLIIKAHPDPERYRDPMIEALTQLGMDEKKAVNMVEKAYEEKGYIGKQVQSRAQAQGYDGLMQYDRNGDLSEVVSYNPNAIKSAIGNEGTYDTSIPHMGKADGGKIAKGLMGALTKAKELAQAEKPMVNRLDMNFKDVTKRVPELTEAANMLARGEITAAQYDALVTRLKPVTPYSFVPAPATTEDAMRALTENKKPMFGKTGEMSAGEQADLRLDIPAYKDHGVWVNSIHRKDQPTVYGSTSSVKNATMIGAPDKALKVAQGGPKAPFAVIRGDWNPMSEEAAVAKAQEYLDHPDWKQVGYDPERHGYFYDRATMKPVQGAEEVIQIGPLVLAKKPTYGKKSEEKYVDGGKVAKGIVGALTKASNAADAIMAAKKIEAPSIIIPSRISDVKEAVRQSKGDYGARRVERAADEIPNLEKMYKDEALRQAFTGDNAKALMTMNPAKFEKYSEPLDPRFTDADSKRFTTSGEQLTYPKYMEDYLPNVGAFDDVPFLQINKPKQGSPLLPFISGHEGRHRNRVMADRGDEAGLVQLLPSYELREPFPRRSQEEYIEALKEELLMTGNKVRPETIFKSFNFNEPRIKRPSVKLPDIYADGGGVRHMVDGGKMAKGVVGALAKAREAAQAQKDLRVYHGSPHKFDRFDASKIGTGEGAQAYGHGIYTAEAPDVAQSYADKLGGGQFGSTSAANGSIADRLSSMFYGDGSNFNRGSRDISTLAKNMAIKTKVDANGLVHHQFKDGSEWIGSPNGWDVANIEKNLYKVNLPDEIIAKMLDWDKPLSQQSAEVQKVFGVTANGKVKLPNGEVADASRLRGESAYRAFAESMSGDSSAASSKLRELGIPGIKYLDATSRGAGQGTRNFVTFPGEEQNLTILERNGQPMSVPSAPEGMAHGGGIPHMGKSKGGVLYMADAGRVAKGIVGALTKASKMADDAMAASRVLPVAERDVNLAKMLHLYHGSYKPINKIKDEGLFGGVFVSPNKNSALSHGDYLHLVQIPESKVLTQDHLNFHADPNKVKKVIDDEYPNLNSDEYNHMYDAIVGDKGFYNSNLNEDRILKLTKSDDLGEAGWEAQKIRGKIAKKLGFDAIEMADEHGVSYLALPNNEIKNIKESHGGVIHMADAGRVGKGIVGALTKAMEIAKAKKAAVVEATPTIEAVVNAADRAAAGRKAADVAKATAPMKMSEALGKMNLEGKGKLRIAQADRTRVGGGNIGGPMFPGLQQVDPSYEGAAWGVGKKGTASAMINDSDANTLWSTVLGSEDQLKSNPMVFNKLRRAFTDSMKQGNLSPELEAKINHNLALTFGEGANIRDPKIWQSANTYEKRGALADLMLGQGIAPGKGGVALGGEKSGKGVIFRPSDILKQETEPMLLHPEHGGDVPTFAVGPRLFSLSGETMTRPDLHPGFPVILKGEDKGVVFSPVAGAEAMPEFVKRYKDVKGREPTGYFDWTKGLQGEGLPSQSITDEYLTYLQKAGKKEGGVMKKPDWHLAVEQKIKDDGYSFVESPNRMSDGGLPDEGAAFGVYRKPKGGEDIRRGGKETGEVFNILGDMVKEQSSKEVESLGKNRATSDLLNRGVLANNPLSVVIDMVNMGLVPFDVLGSKLTGRDIRVSSDKPFLGSEYVKDLMNQYGVTSGEERPMMELGLGLLGPNSIIKGSQKTADLAKKAPEAFGTVRGGLETMSANAQRPFRPATLTMEAVAPDLGQKGGDKFKDLVTKRMISGEGAPVNMGTMGGRKTEQTMGQGLYENFAGQQETNPMVGITIPRAGNLSTNKRLIADIGTAGQELGQEMVAAHKFTPLMFKNPKDATAMMIGGSERLTKEQIQNIADALPNMIVTHSPKNNSMFVAPFEGDALDYKKAAQTASEILGKNAKVQFGKADSKKDIMFRGDYDKMEARPPSAESTEMRNRLKKAEARIVRGPSVSQSGRQSPPATLTSTVR